MVRMHRSGQFKGISMIDVTKIDDAIKYLDFEPKKKSGRDWWWLAALVLPPYVFALAALILGAVLQARR